VLPGAAGTPETFRRITPALGPEQPVYGLRHREIDGPLPLHPDVEAMATDFIQQVRALAPAGPYFFCGYSAGGLIAYEMARQLTAAGERVAGLILLDTRCPVLPARGRADRLRMHAERLLRQGPRYLVAKIGDRLRKELDDRSRRNRVATPDKDTRAMEAWWGCKERYHMRPYDGRAQLIRVPYDLADEQTDRVLDATLGWGAFVRGGVEIIEVPGTHLQLWDPPHVDAVAAALARLLERLQGEAGTRAAAGA
jgi:thioesterase domain-containing protein